MLTRKIILCGALAAFLVPLICRAQEGYPLDGTWRGQWLDQDGDSHLVVMVLKWDGERINGIINPGRHAFEFKTAALEPGSWTFSMEADNNEGLPVRFASVLSNIGSYHRTMDGTWLQDGSEFPLRMQRE